MAALCYKKPLTDKYCATAIVNGNGLDRLVLRLKIGNSGLWQCMKYGSPPKLPLS